MVQMCCLRSGSLTNPSDSMVVTVDLQLEVDLAVEVLRLDLGVVVLALDLGVDNLLLESASAPQSVGSDFFSSAIFIGGKRCGLDLRGVVATVRNCSLLGGLNQAAAAGGISRVVIGEGLGTSPQRIWAQEGLQTTRQRGILDRIA
mmetsp:Transcript_80542/g.153035  ORF Transcript_80542/g.153035 Transcript_80542/m.153035 type:complete len:146 (-) Transcript_80542:7-444(-)